MKLMVTPKGRYSKMIMPGMHWIYSEKYGYLVLRDETHWTKISGIVFNTKWGCYWWMFRRYHW